LKFERSFRVNTSRQRAWDVLLDAESLYSCIEGCEHVESLGLDKYSAIVKVGISFLKATFLAEVTITEKKPPVHAKILMSGKDSDLGSSVDAIMTIDLDEVSPQETNVGWSAEVNLVGKVASLGQRIVAPLAEKKISAFVECVKKKLDQA
jgi:hypothetical protein